MNNKYTSLSREEIQKKLTIVILIFAALLVIGFIVVGVGGSFLEDKLNQTKYIIGIILLVMGISLLVLSFVLLIYKSIIYSKLSNNKMNLEFKTSLEANNEHGITEFKTSDNKMISFGKDTFIYDNIEYDNSLYQMGMFIKNISHTLSNSYEIVLVLYKLNNIQDDEIEIKVNKDLIEAIKISSIEYINKEDFDFLSENDNNIGKLINKMLMHNNIFGSPMAKYVPIKCIKNNKDKKNSIKSNTIHTISIILSIIFVIGINVLFIWLFDSKDGIKISDTVTFNIGFKIITSFIILSIAFVKNKNGKWYIKLALVLFVISYWIFILFSNVRGLIKLFFIFTFVYSILSGYVFYKAYKIEDKKEKLKAIRSIARTSILIPFLILLLCYFAMDYEILDDGIKLKIGIISAIIFALLFLVIYIPYYIKKQEKEEDIDNKKKNKKSLILYICSLPMYMLMIGAFFSMFIIPIINYAFDKDVKETYSEKIIEMSDGSENTSAKAKIIFNNKEIEIPISNKDYYEYKVGDNIEFSIYNGALGYKYILKEK